MALFFTSDTHFGDHRVLNLYPRPFAGPAEMDAALIAAWNERVGPDDEVFHLGDFARGLDRAAEVLPRLAGRVHLLAGNNDPEAVRGLPFASVGDYLEISEDGRRLVLCHYPFRSWNGQAKGAVNLHGHSHGRLRPKLPRQIDVGVDVQGYRPRTLAELLSGESRARAPSAP